MMIFMLFGCFFLITGDGLGFCEGREYSINVQ
jgi:hypothetical protein